MAFRRRSGRWVRAESVQADWAGSACMGWHVRVQVGAWGGGGRTLRRPARRGPPGPAKGTMRWAGAHRTGRPRSGSRNGLPEQGGAIPRTLGARGARAGTLPGALWERREGRMDPRRLKDDDEQRGDLWHHRACCAVRAPSAACHTPGSKVGRAWRGAKSGLERPLTRTRTSACGPTAWLPRAKAAASSCDRATVGNIRFGVVST